MSSILERAPRVFLHCHDTEQTAGGQKDTYLHVDALNDAGIEAYVVHHQPGFRLSWFEHETKVIDIEGWRRLYDAERDYIAISELLAPMIAECPGRTVIFNKSLWLGCAALGKRPLERNPYFDPRVVAILAMSDHNVRHLRYAYPGVPVFHVIPLIDTTRFAFRPLAGRTRRITWVPKAIMSWTALYHMLAARAEAGLNRLRDYEWARLDGMTEAQVVSTLQDSVLCVFLSPEEALGRVPLEAMSCGCLPCGFRNGSLGEIVADEALADWGDLIGLATYIEQITARYPHDIAAYERAALLARERAEAFGRDAHRRSVAAAWEAIMRETAGKRPRSFAGR
jgi:hypothetical protein